MKQTDQIWYRIDSVGKYDYRTYDNLEEATKDATATAWSSGKDQTIFKSFAIARAPEVVKNVKVDTL